MITGIDETGDFDPNSSEFNYFVAAHIDQNGNKYQIKKSQFNIWEGSIPKEYLTEKNEVKGQKLPNKYLESFYNEVLKPSPTLLYSVVRIKPIENPSDLFEKYKKYEIKSIEKVINEAKELGHIQWAKGYESISYWYRNRNFQLLMKMKCLNQLLGVSLNQIIAWGQLMYMVDNKDSSNIDKIKFLIDKDFVKAENVKILWGELFRQFWQGFSKREPIPLIKDIWNEEDHPVNKALTRVEGRLNLKKVFRGNTFFVDSIDSWEVRCADLIGTILHRYQNKGKLPEIGRKVFEHLGGKKNNYVHLILNPEVEFV